MGPQINYPILPTDPLYSLFGSGTPVLASYSTIPTKPNQTLSSLPITGAEILKFCDDIRGKCLDMNRKCVIDFNAREARSSFVHFVRLVYPGGKMVPIIHEVENYEFAREIAKGIGELVEECKDDEIHVYVTRVNNWLRSGWSTRFLSLFTL